MAKVRRNVGKRGKFTSRDLDDDSKIINWNERIGDLAANAGIDARIIRDWVAEREKMGRKDVARRILHATIIEDLENMKKSRKRRISKPNET